MARPREKSDPPSLVQSIQDHAAAVREAVGGLNDRIERFQQYLTTMKGRTETLCYVTHPDYPHEGSDGKCLGLKLHREGKEWLLSYAALDEADPSFEPEWNRMVDAPLKYKVVLARAFPDLLDAIAKTQQKLVNEVVAVTEFLDEFEESLPKKEGN